MDEESPVTETMRTILLSQRGSIDAIQLGTKARPEPGPKQVLVRVHASSVNPADVKLVLGEMGTSLIHSTKLPMQLGYDFSGVIEKLGAQVSGRSVGDEVFGFLPYATWNAQGSFADYLLAKPDRVALKPPGVGHEAAAAAGTAAVTALQGLLERGRLRSGQKLLIHGASGGVGAHAVRIAKILGAEVWGMCSAPKASFVRSLGADQVIDYRTTPLPELGEVFDLVFDVACTSSFHEAAPRLAHGGAYVTLLPSPSLLTGKAASLLSSKRCGYVVVQSTRDRLGRIASWLADGQFQSLVSESFELEATTQALSKLKSGRVEGKLAIRVHG
jgi:NADPH:quinone reductase-like Zn-dependent oxidoreductase